MLPNKYNCNKSVQCKCRVYVGANLWRAGYGLFNKTCLGYHRAFQGHWLRNSLAWLLFGTFKWYLFVACHWWRKFYAYMWSQSIVLILFNSSIKSAYRFCRNWQLGTPQLQFISRRANFGRIAVNMTETKTFYISNTGTHNSFFQVFFAKIKNKIFLINFKQLWRFLIQSLYKEWS